jgi:hypothetical protein
MPPGDGTDEQRKNENRKIANVETSKLRDRQTPNLLQANLGAFALQSAAFLFVTISRRSCKARASRFCRFPTHSYKESAPPKQYPYEATTSTWLNSQRSEERTQEDTMNPTSEAG